MFNKLKDTIPHINSEANPSPPLLMLFASIWDSFSAQALVLRFFQYATKLSKGEGPYLFLESGPFKNSPEFFSEIDLVSIINVRYCKILYIPFVKAFSCHNVFVFIH